MGSIWIALRRPLLVALVLGCAMSLMASGRLTARLAAPAALYWTFLPVLELAGLAAVCRRSLSAKTIDGYFAGYGPWLLWTTGFAAMWAWMPSQEVFARPRLVWTWLDVTPAIALWSGWLDFAFWRRELGRTRGQAARDLAIQRAICWTGALVIFAGPASWQIAAAALGL